MKNLLKLYMSFLFFLFVIISIAQNSEKIKVACVGNSVTFGYGIENRDVNSYPAELQKMLGNKYEVENFGKSGATLLVKGHRPYIQEKEFREALRFSPQIVIIHLGLNDTDPRDWPNYRDDFVKDYSALIDSFRHLPSEPTVWICKMTPIFSDHPRFKSGTRDWFWQIQQKIEVVANGSNTELIDLHTSLYSRPDLFADNLHPNAEGAKIIAKTVYARLTGDFGGLQIQKVFNTHMVLQRGIPIPVFGKANRGDKISVIFDRKIKTVETDKYGNWKVEFPPKKAGGPYTLTIRNSNLKIVVDDVLIGDVWLCSGQSNMAFQLKQTARADKEIQKANYPKIRLLNMNAVVWPGNENWSKEDMQKINSLNYFKGSWEVCMPETAAGFSGVAYSFGRKLKQVLNVPIGLVLNAVGGSPAEAWIDRGTLEFDPQLVNVLNDWQNNDFVQPWCRVRAAVNVKNATNPLQRHPFQPAYLFETGILPLSGFPIKGVIWYQGESNAHNVEFYEVLFPGLVNSWRNVWGDDLPFYFVQLSSLNRPSWGYFRNSQRRLAKQMPNCEMVVSSDLGNPTNVHPKHKKEVGERLALVALKNLYSKDLVWQGPEVENIEFIKNEVKVKYNFAKTLRTNDGKPLRGFEVAGVNQIFKPANTKIIGNTMKLWSVEVSNPKYVRYGWSAFTDANLINEAGLPASTFSSEFEINKVYEKN